MVRHAEAPDGADRFGEGADDEIDLAFQPLVFIHAAAVGAEKAHRMGLVDQHHAAVLLRDSDHFPERRDIAEHRIDAFEHHQLAGVGGQPAEALVELGDVVVTEADDLGHALLAAILTRGVAVRTEYYVFHLYPHA